MERKDCWMIELCKKYDCISNLCSASDDPNPLLNVRRCDAGTKTIIAILDQINTNIEKLGSNR